MAYLMSTKEAALKLGVSRFTLNGLIESGKLNGKRVGKSERIRYVTTESIEKFLKEGVCHG